MSTPTPDRATLIDLCTRGVVPVEHWSNRDSANAQRKLGEARALLSAGCDFEFTNSPEQTTNTIWIRIEFPGFNAFEYDPANKDEWEDELFYIPTPERLDIADGKDWY